MDLYLDKIVRSTKHAISSNRLVYRSRLKNLTSGESLPSDNEALEVVRGLRPPLQSKIPSMRLDWPKEPTVDITIIVPCFNFEQYLEECLLSALNQEFKGSLEVIAIDDGSIDSTPMILERLRCKYSNLRIVSQGNKGFSGARNAGLELATGRYLCFLDSDDLLPSSSLEALIKALEGSKADYATGYYSLVSKKGLRLPIGKRRPHGTVWARLFSREVWRSLAFPEGLWFEDTVFAYLIAPEFIEVLCNCEVYKYRKHEGAITATSRAEKRAIDTFFVTEEMIKWRRAKQLSFDQKMLNQTLKQLGPQMLARTTMLNDYERKCLFVVSSRFLESIDEFTDMSCLGVWQDLLEAFRTRNYGLWKLASTAL